MLWVTTNGEDFMKTRVRIRNHIAFQSGLILGVATLIAGCAASTEPPSGNGGEETVGSATLAAAAPGRVEGESAGTVTVEKPESKKLLATIQQSDTQVIEFWEHTHGVIQVVETGDIDADLHDDASPRRSLLRTNIAGMSLADSYKLLAGAASDEATIAALAGVDRRLGVLTPVAPLQGRANGTTGMLSSGSTAPSSPGGPRPLALRQCQQTTATWDWANDALWFFNTFCGSNSTTCFANANDSWVQGWASYAGGNSWFDATGFEGSFCDSATIDYTITDFACDTGQEVYTPSFTLGPRKYNTQNWLTSGCTKGTNWNAVVYGNWSGLDSQFRLGLAVHTGFSD
jgi:hypothetical protein